MPKKSIRMSCGHGPLQPLKLNRKVPRPCMRHPRIRGTQGDPQEKFWRETRCRQWIFGATHKILLRIIIIFYYYIIIFTFFNSLSLAGGHGTHSTLITTIAKWEDAIKLIQKDSFSLFDFHVFRVPRETDILTRVARSAYLELSTHPTYDQQRNENSTRQLFEHHTAKAISDLDIFTTSCPS